MLLYSGCLLLNELSLLFLRGRLVPLFLTHVATITTGFLAILAFFTIRTLRARFAATKFSASPRACVLRASLFRGGEQAHKTELQRALSALDVMAPMPSVAHVRGLTARVRAEFDCGSQTFSILC